MRVGIIANPGAGTPGSLRVLPLLERFARSFSDDVCTAIPTMGQRIEPIAAGMAASVDLIIVSGGDGTLNGVVNGVMPDACVPVAFLPSGRGKDAARTLPSLSRDDLAESDVSWRIEAVDVGQVTLAGGTVRYFINISSVGLGATAARIATRLPRLPGTANYLIGAAAGLVTDRHVALRVRGEHQDVVDLEDCRIASVANGRYFGGGLQIAPMASAQDGLLEIVTVSGAGRFEILRNLPRVFQGTHMAHPAVRHWTAPAVSIDAQPPVGIETDGEVIGVTPATFNVLPGALAWAALA